MKNGTNNSMEGDMIGKKVLAVLVCAAVLVACEVAGMREPILVPGANLAAKLSWLETHAYPNTEYTVEVSADESMGPTTLLYGNRSNITITLKGLGRPREISLSSSGSMFTIGSGVTLILGNNITLRGRSDNSSALVTVSSGGALLMNAGSVITGNTGGGGVYVSTNGTFRIVSGTVYGLGEGNSSNTATNGAALYNSGTAQYGTFSGSTWSSRGSLSTTNNTIRVVNGVLVNFSAITAQNWRIGDAVSLTAPAITGLTITAQGWQISDSANGEGSSGWADFTPPSTADMSYNGKSLRYYAVSGGQTYYSNVVTITVYNSTFTVTNTNEWNAALNIIRNIGNNQSVTIAVNGSVGVEGTGSENNTFGTATGLSVTLQGNGRLSLTSTGSLIRLAANQTLIIDSASLTLQGRSGNTTSVMYVDGTNAQLALRNGTISGNTSSSSGGGVYVNDGTFTMSGGEISGNTASGNGGGVYVQQEGTFTMSGGEISGNTASYGGGVYVYYNGTFRIVTGTVYGSNENNASLRNTASSGAALNGTAQRGTFSGTTWTSKGSLSTASDTITVVNGELFSITAPTLSVGSAFSLTAPTITGITAQGWQLSDTGTSGWANFTPPSTADMSYNGKSLRYYAVSGGQTYYSNTVSITVYNSTLTVTNTNEWNTAVNTIRTSGNNRNFTITVSGSVSVAGSTADTFGTASGLSVTLQGNGSLSLNSAGSLIRLAANQTLIIDSASLTLQGLKNGQNGATQDNNASVVYVNGSNAQLELKNGTISGNTVSDSGGGVYVNSGTFTMSGGEISGNTASSIGGGVLVSSSGTFTMSGGEISGNTAASSSYGRGGGVYVSSSGTFTMHGGEISGNTAATSYSSSSINGGGGVYVSSSGTFRFVTGTIYGSNVSPTTLRNTAYNGAALYGTAQHGTFSGSTWNSRGSLSTNNNTIRVINGELISFSTITGQNWGTGDAVSLTAPTITGLTITAQGWQLSDSANGEGSSGWADFTPPSTADMSYNGKYLRYYAVSGGQTYYSNTVSITVHNITFTVTYTYQWNGVLDTIRASGNNQSFTITVNGSVGVEGSTTATFGTARGLSVTLQGNGSLSLNSAGNLIRLTGDQTLIIDSASLTLQGTADNTTSVVYVAGAQLELRNGTISDNACPSTPSGGGAIRVYNGGGVYVDSGTFTMYGGKISGNTVSGNGGGVYVDYGTFTMYGGEILGNTANTASYGGGGGVYVGGSNGTFRIVTGTVYGTGEGVLSNTANGAALIGTVQYGTFSGTTWNNMGSLSGTNNTIRVVNGVLQQ